MQNAGGAFLPNHAAGIAAMDLFVVPTIGFDLLYAYIMVRLDRRELIWIGVTTHPTQNGLRARCPLLQRGHGHFAGLHSGALRVAGWD